MWVKSDYNFADNTFGAAYLVAGGNGGDWLDGIGTLAKLNHPYQGVFVKNDEYIANGDSDIYDFYFTEESNHDIRCLTPLGKVSTYAGRGTNGDKNTYGYVDGDLRLEARFNKPKGLAYDEANKIFYVGDSSNHRIRRIGKETE